MVGSGGEALTRVVEPATGGAAIAHGRDEGGVGGVEHSIWRGDAGLGHLVVDSFVLTVKTNIILFNIYQIHKLRCTLVAFLLL